MASISAPSENGSSNATHGQQCDVNNLYRFNPDNRSYIRKARGSNCKFSRKRSKEKQNKLKRVYLSKCRKVYARKNRSCKDVERMSLMCSCEKGCLSKNTHGKCREFIRTLRQSFYKKSYIEQNYIIAPHGC